jgi:tartrate dehydratase alpha subunit/fumarate hydratase class I-like protein
VCRKRIPDQGAAVSISYLGIGSTSMANLHSLPPAAVLRKWLKHTSRAMDAAAKHPGQVGTTLGGRQMQLQLWAVRQQDTLPQCAPVYVQE